MITVTRLLEFDAAHRVMNHESKCATLHGHRYKIEIEATSPDLDGIGRIIDFSVLKERIGGWIDEHWDHTSIICEDDARVLMALRQCPHKKDVFVTDWNPTAENMAYYLLKTVCPRLLGGVGVTVTRVTVWETPNCQATATLEPSWPTQSA